MHELTCFHVHVVSVLVYPTVFPLGSTGNCIRKVKEIKGSVVGKTCSMMRICTLIISILIRFSSE